MNAPKYPAKTFAFQRKGCIMMYMWSDSQKGSVGALYRLEVHLPFIPAPYCVKSTIKGTYIGETVIQTLWSSHGASIDDTILDAVNAGLETWYKAYVLTQLCDQYTLTDITSTDMTTQTGHSRTRLVTSANAGAVGSGDDLPGNVALCVTFNTGKRGRSYRGRVYLGGFNTGSKGSDGNQILGSAAVAFATAFGTNLSNMYGALTPVADHVVVSHYNNKVARTTAYSSVVESVAVNVFWDSQRRRLRGRGK